MALLQTAVTSHAEMSAEELAKLAQNPVGNLISLPFQNNTNFNVGPLSGTQNILNIQPVIPISVNKDWNIITRTILPVVSHALAGRRRGPHQRPGRHHLHRLPVAGPAGRADLGRWPSVSVANRHQRVWATRTGAWALRQWC